MSAYFETWLADRMRDSNLSVTELARKSHLPHSMISKILGGKQKASWDACIALANALDVSPDTVTVLAGYRLPDRKESPQQVEWLNIFSQIQDDDQEELLQLARMKAARHGERKRQRARQQDS